MGELEEDLEWKVTYVGSAEDQTRDQVLEEVMVGPVPQGVSKFVLTAEAPSVQLIPVKDLVGVTVVLITCSYREKEFVRIGYYVNNEYYHASPLDYQRHATHAASAHAAATTHALASGQAPPPPLALPEGPQPVGEDEIAAMLEAGSVVEPSQVFRHVMADKPRVTRFQIDWAPAAQQQLQQAQQAQEQLQLLEQQQMPPGAPGGLPAPPMDPYAKPEPLPFGQAFMGGY